jgi:hypothetical protein
MSRDFHLALSLLALLVSSAAAIGEELLLDEPLPIAFYEAHKLFHQCSRSTPVPDGKIWLPSKAEITRLEADLVEHFANVQRTEIDFRTSKPKFGGQFVGFLRDEVEYIYAAYVANPDDYHSYFFDLDLIPFIKENLDWFSWLREDRAVVFCDGGSWSWGIVYNPATGEFTEYAENGPF